MIKETRAENMKIFFKLYFMITQVMHLQIILSCLNILLICEYNFWS